MITRRTFLHAAAATALAAPLARAADAPVRVRAITKGPKFHWFGYYDKLQFDPASRRVLGMEVSFEHRSPRAEDVIRIGMIDLDDGDRWTDLGESRAWSWQQGCMLQWMPGQKDLVAWNDRDGEDFVCRILDTATGRVRTIGSSVYTISPDGASAITTDFARLQEMRPGYGYAGGRDPYADQLVPEKSGIVGVDLATGKRKLLVPLARAAALQPPDATMKGAKHWFNHLLYNTDGTRFVFLHRWRVGNGWRTRMLTADPDGGNLHLLDPSGETSHFIWRDPAHILAWTRPAGKPWGFYLFKDRTDEVQVIGQGVMTQNGHCTYLPGNRWVLNDTYPTGPKREQQVYLYHVATGRKIPLAAFPLPPEYKGEWRCDTHPRFSPSARRITVDSPHQAGRQIHLLELDPTLLDA